LSREKSSRFSSFWIYSIKEFFCALSPEPFTYWLLDKGTENPADNLPAAFAFE
jgi:hypothetical protein